MAFIHAGNDITAGLQDSPNPSFGPRTGFEEGGGDIGHIYRRCAEVNCPPDSFCMTRNFPQGWEPNTQPGWFVECVPF